MNLWYSGPLSTGHGSIVSYRSPCVLPCMVEPLLMSARHPVPCALFPLMPVSHNGITIAYAYSQQ